MAANFQKLKVYDNGCSNENVNSPIFKAVAYRYALNLAVLILAVLIFAVYDQPKRLYLALYWFCSLSLTQHEMANATI